MIIFLDIISGLSFGLEFYLGAKLGPEDKFAMSVDLGIFRITFVVPKVDETAM